MIDPITLRANRAEIWRALQEVVASANGDGAGILQGLKMRVGNAALSQIQQDFITKSRGGTGLDGVKWQPLSPATIAGRRITTAEKKAAGLTSSNIHRGILTPQQDKRWRQLFAGYLRWLEKEMPHGAAKGKAAAMAWTQLKREGAKTRISTFGNRQVDILRDTGELLRSLAAGYEEQASDAEGQVFRLEDNSVVIGTNKKPQHHEGIPGKLPARPFWRPDGTLSESQWPAVLGAAQRGIAKAIEIVARNKH